MMPPVMDVVVALGSNLGDRGQHLLDARSRLEQLARVVAASHVYETPPVGPPQGEYLNAALLVETSIDPEALLAGCLEIERSLGRVRAERWGPRTIDLDLLWADDEHGARTVSSPTLTLPHPQLSERAFALAPLLDVRPDLEPRFGASLAALGGRPRVVEVKGWTSFRRRK